jgi:RNA polymerase sigma-70 factor (ECF subfamily)
MMALVLLEGFTKPDAEDAIQIAAVRALRGPFVPDPTRDPRDAFKAWIVGILAHVVAEHRRALRRGRDEVPLDTAELSGPSHEGRVEARELGRALASSTTPERWRALLGAAEGFTAAELATAEGIPLGTLYSRLWKGRAALVRVLRRARRPLRSK